MSQLQTDKQEIEKSIMELVNTFEYMHPDIEVAGISLNIKTYSTMIAKQIESKNIEVILQVKSYEKH